MPPEVRRQINEGIVDAFIVAEEGRPVAAFILLRHGERQALESTEPWAAQALLLWQRALATLAERYPTEHDDLEVAGWDESAVEEWVEPSNRP